MTTSVFRSPRAMRAIAIALGAAGAMAWSAAAAGEPAPRAAGWLVKSHGQFEPLAAPATGASELAALRAIVAKRTDEDVARFRWWSAGGPVHRWNEIILDEMQESFVTMPLAARHLALFHAALDDAVATARHHRASVAPAEPAGLDAAFAAVPSSPSEYAAAAAAAADVLGYLFPARAAHFAAKAEEAIQTRLIAGAEYPYEAAAGRSIGQRVAALAIARGMADGSGEKWTGVAPEGPGLWKSANPITPQAARWRPWALAQAGEFRPAAPPAVDSAQVKSALDELKAFQRTPKTNHRAVFWEVHGGARVHALWNEIARMKLLEHRYAAPVAARVLAALNIAMADAGIACWDAKYAYWYPRPAQLEPELKPLFPSPNHPSFPSAHGCFSTAAATVLAAAFPADRDRLLALGREAAEARVWAGIHYRFDIEVGEELGRKVAERTLERAFAARIN